MPEARDRRSTTLDIAAVFAHPRASIFGVFDDELETRVFGSTPRRPAAAPTGSGHARVGFRTPRSGRGSVGSSRSVLPSWYPRTPLRNITPVMRAIERRGARLGANEGTSFPADQRLRDPSVSADNAHLEHDASVITPKPALGVKLRTRGGNVPKILLDIANQTEEVGSELTPQKKLLNSIDNVEKVVREELHRLKRTPSAKKVEREKRVRTLMSMR